MTKTLTRVRKALGLPDDRPLGKSFEERFTPEQHLRANSALSSIETDVFMGKKDADEITATAVLLLRGVNRLRWADA